MNSKLNILGVGGGVLMAVGAFLPWIIIAGISVSGWDGSDGKIVLAAGVLTAIFYVMNKRWSNIVGIICSLLVVAEVVRILMAAKGEVSAAAGTDMGVGFGIGLWVMLAGGVLGILGGIMAMRGGSQPVAATA